MSAAQQLFDGDSRLEPLLGESQQTEKPDRKPDFILSKVKVARFPGIDAILAGMYLAFLVWQSAVLVPYAIHTLHCVFTRAKLGFTCKTSPIPYALELELAMYISMASNMMLFLWLTSKIPHFPGYKAICAKLVRLSKFWSFVFLSLLQLVGLMAIPFGDSDGYYLRSALIVSFVCHGTLVLALVGVVNFTQGDFIKQKYPYYKFVFFKLTLAVFLAQSLVLFLLGALETAAGVTGLDPHASPSPFSFEKAAFKMLRHFADNLLYYKISDFLWQKLFADDINILHYHGHL